MQQEVRWGLRPGVQKARWRLQASRRRHPTVVSPTLSSRYTGRRGSLVSTGVCCHPSSWSYFSPFLFPSYESMQINQIVATTLQHAMGLAGSLKDCYGYYMRYTVIFKLNDLKTSI